MSQTANIKVNAVVDRTKTRVAPRAWVDIKTPFAGLFPLNQALYTRPDELPVPAWPHPGGARGRGIHESDPLNTWSGGGVGMVRTDDPGVGARLLTSPVRREIVDALANLDQGEVGMSAAALAELLELHVTTVRFHLEQLIAAGILNVESRRGQRAGRPTKIYTVAPGRLEFSESSDAYKVLIELLAEAFASANSGTVLTPEQAGHQWAEHRIPASGEQPAGTAGSWLAKVGQMLDHLSDWGYAPEVATLDHGRTAEITLHKCPFLDLAHTNPQVVCGVHRGLIAGSMGQLGEDDLSVSLRPFTGPDTCSARLTTRTPFHRNVTRAQPPPSTQGPTS